MRNLAQLWRREALGIGVYRKPVLAALFSDLSFRWVQHQAAGAATIAIYSADFLPDDAELEDTNPSTNPYWTLESGAVFASSPMAAIGSAVLTLSDNPFAALLVELNVTLALSEFSFLVRTQARAHSG